MASKSARKRRKRRPPPRSEPATGEVDGEASNRPVPAAKRPRNVPEPPPAPWGSFPLAELAVLVGIVMLVLGFFFVEGSRGPILIATGLLLGSIGGLELSIREHFAGYKSHTMVLAGVPAMITLGLLFYLGHGLPPLARAGIGIAVFVLAGLLLSRAFSRRSGGSRFKLRP